MGEHPEPCGDVSVLFCSQGSCQWVNIQSRVVALCDTTLLQLTEIEAAAVQQVALQRLADFNLGCTVRIPKGGSW